MVPFTMEDLLRRRFDVSVAPKFDGSVHQDPEQREYDSFRDTALQEHGLIVLRFTNDEVETAIDSVLAQIVAAAETSLPSGSPSPSAFDGEGARG